ncbi:iron-containing alcohol dehydrogenase [Halomonas sp. ML-15]|uniref:iron-containing alcohol dehydrogenase n=1 Tax=Halomonas sp. ML-15 TaxID=2773305 RepID=UPI001747516A|nr:iron-containing alcohol dehydrogenase [Halomonas sp. ML-15]MBD3897542.1 iron-containing alcohol dehydrogenase [Halomonas sp. ML-15]
MPSPFPAVQVSRLPEIHLHAEAIRRLPALVEEFGQHVLLVTGRHSFVASPHWPALLGELKARNIEWQHASIDGEPSPQRIDELVSEHRQRNIDVVVAIGGGSALDAGKAVAGLLKAGNSVMDHLEGVGRGLTYQGPAVPMIAVPTTAGTGSEATKNAVLSVQGRDGFKKSFRDAQLVPRIALVDPALLVGCPRPQLAANAMDALTQLLESYVSLKANAFTDALAWAGLEALQQGLWGAWQADAGQYNEGYTRLAYASLSSGITLAQAGLGAVHGLASPLGAFFPMPHGAVCGTLLAEATATNLAALEAHAPASPARGKYARVGRLLSGNARLNDDDANRVLVETLHDWSERLEMPRLGRFGMSAEDIPRVVANARGGSMQTNPLVLSDEALAELLTARL